MLARKPEEKLPSVFKLGYSLESLELVFSYIEVINLIYLLRQRQNNFTINFKHTNKMKSFIS